MNCKICGAPDHATIEEHWKRDWETTPWLIKFVMTCICFPFAVFWVTGKYGDWILSGAGKDDK